MSKAKGNQTKNNPSKKDKKKQAEEELTSENTYSQHTDIDFEELKKQALSQDSCDIMVKLTYQGKHKYIDTNPNSLKELKNQVNKLFDTSKCKKDKWSFFYFDSHFDRIDISHTRDLKLAYKVSLHIESKVLKIYAWDSDQKLPEYKDLHSMNQADYAIQQNKIIKKMNQHIYGATAEKTSWTTVSDKTEGPTINSDVINAAKSSIASKSTSAAQEETQKPISINDTFKSLQNLSSEDLNKLNEIKHSIVEQLKKNVDVQKEEVVKELRKSTKFLALVETQDLFIQHIYNETRKKLLEIQTKQQIDSATLAKPLIQDKSPAAFDIKNLKTIRNTTFGRMSIDTTDGDQTLKLHFLVSDFEIQILRANQNDGQSVYIECGLSISEGVWQTSLNIFIYDSTTKMYMPIGHWLMERKWKVAYQTALNWYKKELSTFFKPNIVFWDFDFELHESIKSVFSGVQVFVEFNRMTKSFYELAKTHKLFENNAVTDRVRALILWLKSLAFWPSGIVKENFNKIKTENNENFKDIKDNYEVFINSFESSYLSTFKTIDWWNQNHAKLIFLDQIKIVNISDEVIWKLYKSFISNWVNQKCPSESNLYNFLNALQNFENKVKTGIFDKIKAWSEDDVIGDTPFSKNLDCLVAEDLDKIFNFEELNVELLDSEAALSTLGLRIDQSQSKDESSKHATIENPEDSANVVGLIKDKLLV